MYKGIGKKFRKSKNSCVRSSSPAEGSMTRLKRANASNQRRVVISGPVQCDL